MNLGNKKFDMFSQSLFVQLFALIQKHLTFACFKIKFILFTNIISNFSLPQIL